NTVGVAFSNTGTVRVLSGTLSLTGTITQFSSGSTLTGGTWSVLGGTLSLTANPSNITTIGSGATVTVGDSASFPKLDGSLTTVQGSFTTSTAKTFFAPAAVSDSGTVNINSGTTLDVSGLPTSGLVSLWHAEGNANDSADGNNGTFQNGA